MGFSPPAKAKCRPQPDRAILSLPCQREGNRRSGGGFQPPCQIKMPPQPDGAFPSLPCQREGNRRSGGGIHPPCQVKCGRNPNGAFPSLPCQREGTAAAVVKPAPLSKQNVNRSPTEHFPASLVKGRGTAAAVVGSRSPAKANVNRSPMEHFPASLSKEGNRRSGGGIPLPCQSKSRRNPKKHFQPPLSKGGEPPQRWWDSSPPFKGAFLQKGLCGCQPYALTAGTARAAFLTGNKRTPGQHIVYSQSPAGWTRSLTSSIFSQYLLGIWASCNADFSRLRLQLYCKIVSTRLIPRFRLL